MATDEYPPYKPMPSLGHELGLMFGFLALCIVAMGAYIALWRVSQTRIHAQDLARRKALRSKNTAPPDPVPGTSIKPASPGNDVPYEKMLDRYAMPGDRAELPVHGMDLFAAKGAHSTEKGVGSSPRIGSPLGQSRPLSPVTPVSPLGGNSGLASRAVSPVAGAALGSIVGLALGPERSGSPVGGLRSASPARRVGGFKPPVEIGPAPSRE